MADTKQKSDLSRAFKEDGARKTHVGGQALIEGIMMRGKYNWAVGVREPSGAIYVEEHDLSSGKKKNKWMYWPIVRGCRALVESLMLGYKALEIAALHAFNESDSSEAAAEPASETPATAEPTVSLDGGASREASKPAEDKPFTWKDDFGRPETMIDALGAQSSLEVVEGEASPEETPGQKGRSSAEAQLGHDRAEAVVLDAALESEFDPQGLDPQEAKEVEEAEFGKREMAISMVLGLVLGVVLFIVAPAAITNLIVGEYDSNTLLWNIVDGILRVAVFVFYLWLIGRMSDIKRMFGYHGAEHKTIHCYEHGLELTPENARSFPRLHVRCGTAFLIMVMIIAILVYTITPINALIAAWGVPDGLPKLALVIASRIILMPVIAGISYEITVKWAGSRPDNPLVKVILWPGMQMQYLTTNEPDDGQIECAIAAMQRVLEREEAEASKAEAADGPADVRAGSAA